MLYIENNTKNEGQGEEMRSTAQNNDRCCVLGYIFLSEEITLSAVISFFGTIVASFFHFVDLCSDIYMVIYYNQIREHRYFVPALSVLVVSTIVLLYVSFTIEKNICMALSSFMIGPASKYCASKADREKLIRDSDYKHEKGYHHMWQVGVVGLLEDIPQAIITVLYLVNTSSKSTAAYIQVSSSLLMGFVKFTVGFFMFLVWACCGYQTED